MNETILRDSRPNPPALSGPTWENILDDFMLDRPIPREEKQGGAMILSREYDAKLKRAIWTKRYKHGTDSKFLRARIFNEWEESQLRELVKLKSDRIQQLAAAEFKSSHLNEKGQTTLRTYHAGPDILRLATAKPLYSVWGSQKQSVGHPFNDSVNFLRLAKAALEALECLHEHHFVHCDLNPSNLALQVDATLEDSERGQVLRLKPRWHELALIDFGYSLRLNGLPPVPLPLAPDAPYLSVHLRRRLEQIHGAAEKHFDYASNSKKAYDSNAWSQWGRDSPLKLLEDVDWREDIHQLGYLLKQIRGWECENTLWLNGVIMSEKSDIRKLVSTLPEQMLAYGDEAQFGTSCPPQMPHRDWIVAIDSALRNAPRFDGWLLHRADFEPGPEPEPIWRPLLKILAGVGLAAALVAQPRTITRPPIVNLPEQPKPNCTGECPKMVPLPTGEFKQFMMGAQAGEAEPKPGEAEEAMRRPDLKIKETSQHGVTIDYRLALGKHEVTRGEFKRFVDDKRSSDKQFKTEAEKTGGCMVFKDGKFQQDPEASWQKPGFDQSPNDPVVCVSWNDAQKYVFWLNQKTGLKPDAKDRFRLPSEAEWEYAARAETTTPFAGGDCINTEQANYDGTKDYKHCGAKTGKYAGRTLPVGDGEDAKKRANPWGLVDMHGNAREWVEDCFHPDYQGAPVDGRAWAEPCDKQGDEQRRIVRGGSWYNDPDSLRAAARTSALAIGANAQNGFRLARTLTDQSR